MIWAKTYLMSKKTSPTSSTLPPILLLLMVRSRAAVWRWTGTPWRGSIRGHCHPTIEEFALILEYPNPGGISEDVEKDYGLIDCLLTADFADCPSAGGRMVSEYGKLDEKL